MGATEIRGALDAILADARRGLKLAKERDAADLTILLAGMIDALTALRYEAEADEIDRPPPGENVQGLFVLPAATPTVEAAAKDQQHDDDD